MHEANSVWGYGVPFAPEQGVGAYLWIYADFSHRPPLDAVFEQVAGKLDSANRNLAPKYGNRIIHGLVALGYERADAPEAELHEAYNRMWERHPDLWARIQDRGAPMVFWAVDGAGRPFFAIIQPSMLGEFEQFLGPDARESEMYQRYAASESGLWQSVILPVEPAILDDARAKRGR
jgi:hypothetical protein